MSATPTANVLIAENDGLQFKGLRNFFTTLGFRVLSEGETVDSQVAAKLAILRYGAPDLAVLDIELNGSSGLDLGEWLKREYPLLPVVFLTSKDKKQEYIERSGKLMNEAFLAKSEMDIERSQLRREVERLGHRIALRRQERTSGIFRVRKADVKFEGGCQRWCVANLSAWEEAGFSDATICWEKISVVHNGQGAPYAPSKNDVLLLTEGGRQCFVRAGTTIKEMAALAPSYFILFSPGMLVNGLKLREPDPACMTYEVEGKAFSITGGCAHEAQEKLKKLQHGLVP